MWPFKAGVLMWPFFMFDGWAGVAGYGTLALSTVWPFAVSLALELPLRHVFELW